MSLLPQLPQREFQAVVSLMTNAVLNAATVLPQVYYSVLPDFSASVTPDSARCDVIIIRDAEGTHQFNIGTWVSLAPRNFQVLASLFYSLRERRVSPVEEQLASGELPGSAKAQDRRAAQQISARVS